MSSSTLIHARIAQSCCFVLLCTLLAIRPALSFAGSVTVPAASLAKALNGDGTLRAGAAGSFDARRFRMFTAPDGCPVFRPAAVAGAGDEKWQEGFSLRGADEPVMAVLKSGTDIYVGGFFTSIGNVVAKGVAKWNGSTWSKLGAGVEVDGDFVGVYSLAIMGGDVYAAGRFSQAGGVAVNNIAKWNGTAWSSVGAGLSSTTYTGVYDLDVIGSTLYAAGDFTHAGGTVVNGIARWNGTGWSSLGSGISGGNIISSIYDLLVSGTDLYVAGDFAQAGGATAGNIAKWNGTAWSSLGTGVNGGIANALAMMGTDLYVAGDFAQAGGVAADKLARWNGSSWSGLTTNTNGSIYSLAVLGNSLYIGGNFNSIGGIAANNIVRWSGSAWSTLGTGPANGLTSRNKGREPGFGVFKLVVLGNDLYATGEFAKAGGAAANNVAKWNGSAWNSLSSGVANGVSGDIYTIVVAGSDVYVGGYFNHVGSVDANNVAKWNGTAWSSLGSGITGIMRAGYVQAIALSGTDVYVGGDFDHAGGVSANHVARWNGSAWSALGTSPTNGLTGGDYVSSLLVVGPDLYVGGNFTLAGGVPANYIAKWNGTTWSSLGTGSTNGVSGGGVNAMLMLGTDLYTAGVFNQAGGLTVNNLAKWNGTAWSGVGGGVINATNTARIYSLVQMGQDLYVGGEFSQAGNITVNNIARWNGTAWSSLGTGLTAGRGDTGAGMLAVSGTTLYVGGDFTQAGGVAANNVALWSGSTWSTLGTGLNDVVYGLATGTGGKLYVGGHFTAVGDDSKTMAHFGVYDPATPMANNKAAAYEALLLYPNPAHGKATLTLAPATAARIVQVVDALGRMVQHSIMPANTTQTILNTAGLPVGVYTVRCGTAKARLVVE